MNANDLAFENSRSYTDVLPTLNFVLNATDQQKIRFAAARVLSAQNLNDLGRGLSYNFTRAAPQDCPGGGVCFKFAQGTAGNANLDPFRATQVLLSWEDYFAPGGLLSVGGYYKQVDNFVTQANVATFVADGTTAGGSTGNVATVTNGGSGKVYGVELGAQYFFANGLGFQANYTRSDSESTQSSSFGTNLPIPGVPKNTVNLIGYFERAGFSARVAYAWRDVSVNSNFVGSSFTFQDLAGNPKTYTIYQAPYGQLDAQVGYEFRDHIGIVLQAVNVTNEKQHTYLQFKNEPFTYDDSGRRLFFGFKAKL